jgi:hypothetical protein
MKMSGGDEGLDGTHLMDHAVRVDAQRVQAQLMAREAECTHALRHVDRQSDGCAALAIVACGDASRSSWAVGEQRASRRTQTAGSRQQAADSARARQQTEDLIRVAVCSQVHLSQEYTHRRSHQSGRLQSSPLESRVHAQKISSEWPSARWKATPAWCGCASSVAASELVVGSCAWHAACGASSSRS